MLESVRCRSFLARCRSFQVDSCLLAVGRFRSLLPRSRSFKVGFCSL